MTFTLYPAIDLKGGVCVRLRQGDMQQATVFHERPIAQAQSFAAQGCAWLHVVDLDGACEGSAINGEVIRGIVQEVPQLSIQIGGGIRSYEDAATWLRLGVSRVIIGTLAVHHPEIVEALCRDYPGRIIVGLDAWHGKVAISGWKQVTDWTVDAMMTRYADAGVAAFICTAIERDGMLQGVDLAGLAAILDMTSVPIIASGGVHVCEDIRKLCALRGVARNTACLAGVVVGRALYEGSLTVEDALASVRIHGGAHAVL